MKKMMKSIMLGFALMIAATMTKAQGLENVQVEIFYVSNAADAAGSAGTLPAGSITYRIYVDMLPGYNFQALYGLPGKDTLRIQTSTSFFNNEDYGGTTPTISTTNVRKNSALLDSYFSVGGAANGRMGVLKTEDTDGSPGNADNILQNNDPYAGGIPINIGTTTNTTARDGMIPGSPVAVTFVGISAAQLDVFDGTSQAGNFFETENGSVAALGGATGPTAANRVLVGQFTTNGVFSFAFNIQIGTPGGGVENYVHSNPAAGEFTAPFLKQTFAPPGSNVPPTISIVSPANGSSVLVGSSLTINANANDADGTIDSVQFFVDAVYIGSDLTGPNPYTINWTATLGPHTLTARAYDNNGASTLSSGININVTSNPPPAVAITSPANGALFTAPAVVNISANATDPNGTVDSVQFFVNGVYVGSDITPPTPFTFAWTSVIGSASLTARAWDNNGASTLSAAVVINVLDPNALGYRVTTVVANCSQNLFCIPVTAVDAVDNIIGYDVVLDYDETKVTPTGVISVSNALINPAWTSTAHSINSVNGTMNISVFFNANAPASAKFQGTGDIFCVQFSKNITFGIADTAEFTVTQLQESYANGVQQQLADPGKFITFSDADMDGKLKFWYDSSPIKYDAFNPAAHLITNVYGNDNTCANRSATAVQPDLNGDFTYDTQNGSHVEIIKDIAGATDVQPVINGFDAFLTRLVLINDLTFIPTIFQIISMDVNTDGVVSAGDLSQINQRAVLQIPEFKQSWNYDINGLPLGPPSKDWLFINQSTLNTNLAYQISTTYPGNDGVGYSKAKVPQVPFCLPVPSIVLGGCVQIQDATYFGMLLGDVNGNFATVVPNSEFRAGSDKVVFDMEKARIENGYMDVPVSFVSNEKVHAIDFALQFNNSKLEFNTIVNHNNDLQVLANMSATDNTLRFTSNSLVTVAENSIPVSVRFAVKSNEITANDLTAVSAFLNGERTGAEVKGAQLTADFSGVMVNVFPNPAHEMLNVSVSEDASVQLLDITGKQILVEKNILAGEVHQLDVRTLAKGVYVLKVFNKGFISLNKVVLN